MFSVIHCSDGWDRTTQLSCLAQIMMDSYFRTITGFEILLEKEWLSFGHKFSERCKQYPFSGADNEESPVFLQFLDCVHQLIVQFPLYFEYNTKFLMAIYDHANSGLFGTFLGDNEKERTKARAQTRTISLWTYLNKNKKDFENSKYTNLNRVLVATANLPALTFWHEFYTRRNKELVFGKIYKI